MKINHKKSILPIVISAILLGGIGACSSEKTNAEYLASAKQYLASGNNSSAVVELKNAIKNAPSNVVVRELLGDIYLNVGDAAKAEKELSRAYEYGSMSAAISLLKAYKIQQKNEEVLALSSKLSMQSDQEQAVVEIYKGLALYRLGQDEEAEESINYANELATDSIYSRLGKAYLATKQKKNEEAIKIVTMLVNENPEFIDALLLLGQLQFAYKDYYEAITSFMKYQELQPKDLSIKLMLANAYVKNNQLQEAEEYLDELLLIAPEHAFTNQLKGFVRYSLNDYTKAQLFLNKAIQKGITSPENLLLAGYSAFKLKNYEQSYNQLRSIEDLLPSSHPAMKLLAVSQLKLGYSMEASDTLLKLENLSEEDIDLYSKASYELMKEGKWKEAKLVQNKVNALVFTDAVDIARKGILKLSMIDVEGVADLENALSLDSNMPEAKLALAGAYLQNNNYRKAHDLANKWLSNDRDDILAHNLNALAFLKEGNELEAKLAMEEALEIKSDNPLSLMFFAKLALKEDDAELALTYLDQLLAKKPNHLAALSAYYAATSKIDKENLAVIKIKNSFDNNQNSLTHRLLYAKVLFSSKQTAEVISLLSTINTDNQLPDFYWTLLGDSYLALNQFTNAEQLFDQWAKVNPKNKQAWIKLALTAELNTDVVKGLNTITNGLKELKSDTQLLILQTHFYIKNDENILAQRNLNQLDKETQAQPAVQGLQGKVWANENRFDEALPKLLVSYKASPSSNNAGIIYIVYRAKKDMVTGITFLEEHLLSYPNDNKMRSLLAETYMRSNDNKALTHYQKLVHLVPNNIGALNNLAWLEYQRENYIVADEWAMQALSLDGENPNILDTAGIIKLEINDVDNALKYLKAAIELAPNNETIKKHYQKAQKMK
jgi:putative PEP-CTERM system TPR-repeat lipoprotein